MACALLGNFSNFLITHSLIEINLFSAHLTTDIIFIRNYLRMRLNS